LFQSVGDVGLDGIDPAGATGVEGDVPGDRQQPGVDGTAPWVIARGMAPCPDERFLGQILGDRSVADDRSGQTEHAPLVATHERCSCFLIADGERREQHVVIDVPHGSDPRTKERSTTVVNPVRRWCDRPQAFLNNEG
jgi:hypothetical protein